MPATINPSLWRGAAGLAASLGLCNLAPDVRAGSAKTKGRDQAPEIDRPHRLDVGGGISKSTRANLHPGYAAVQRLIDHNAALKKKEFVGQKYKYCDMQRAAADHGLTIGKVTLAKMVKDDPSVGLRPGQARLLPPQAEKDLATVFTCAQESGVARAQGWLAQSIGDLSKGQENQARDSAQTRNKSPDELMSMPRPNRQAARGLMARQDLWNKKHKAVDAKHAGLLVSEFNEHCDVARRMFMYPYFDPGWSQRLKWFSKPHDGSDGPASADVYLPIYDARNSASTSPFVPSDCPSGADAPTGQDVPPVHNPMSEQALTLALHSVPDDNGNLDEIFLRLGDGQLKLIAKIVALNFEYRSATKMGHVTGGLISHLTGKWVFPVQLLFAGGENYADRPFDLNLVNQGPRDSDGNHPSGQYTVNGWQDTDSFVNFMVVVIDFIKGRRARLDLSADEDDEVFEEGDAAEEHGDGDRDRMREGIHLKYRWFNFWLDHASMHINDRIARLCDLYKKKADDKKATNKRKHAPSAGRPSKVTKVARSATPAAAVSSRPQRARTLTQRTSTRVLSEEDEDGDSSDDDEDEWAPAADAGTDETSARRTSASKSALQRAIATRDKHAAAHAASIQVRTAVQAELDDLKAKAGPLESEYNSWKTKLNKETMELLQEPYRCSSGEEDNCGEQAGQASGDELSA